MALLIVPYPGCEVQIGVVVCWASETGRCYGFPGYVLEKV